MVGAITFGGLATGLDTGAIIQALLDVERVPIRQLENRRDDEQQKINLIGTLRGNVQALRDKAAELSTLDKFLDFTTEVSLDGIVSASANSTATAGTHTVESVFVATADRWAFDGVNDPDADLGTADGQGISFDYDGTSYSITLNQANSSLNDVASAINSQAGDAVTALVVNTGTAGSPSYELVLSGDDTGRDFRISNLSSSLTSLTVDGTGPDAGGVAQSINNITVADNAVAVIDGLVIERATNDFSDVLDGISLDLVSAAPGTQVAITVAPDREAIRAKVGDFVDAYNAVIDFIGDQSSFSEEGGAGGPLFGDGLLRTVRGTMSTALFNQTAAAAQADTEGFSTLRLLGISSGSDGRLTIDDTVLDQKLDDDLDAFAELFVDTDGFDNGGALPGDPGFGIDLSADTGLADDLMRALDGLLKSTVNQNNDSVQGVFDLRVETLNGNIRRFEDQIDVRERQIETFEEQLVARFSALEQLIGQLNAQGDFLSAAGF